MILSCVPGFVTLPTKVKFTVKKNVLSTGTVYSYVALIGH